MRFSDPAYLWLLLLLPVLLVLVLRTETILQKIRQAFALRRPRRHRTRRIFRIICPLLALCTTIFALSRPAVEMTRPRSLSSHIALAIGIDVSKSMLAEDIILEDDSDSSVGVSNRINQARQFATGLLNELTNEQVGLFFFAKNGIEAVPLTHDHGFLRYVLKYTNAADLTESGSDLRAALQAGTSMLEGIRGPEAQAIVLITDGEDTENSLADIIKSASMLRQEGIKLYCIGTGRGENVFIPVRKKGLTEIDGFYTDKQGSYLQTRQEEQSLREIAASADGLYYNLLNQSLEQAAHHLNNDLISNATKTIPQIASDKSWQDMTPFLIFATLALYAAYFLL